MKANFGAKNFEFAVTTYQMAVLLIFNDEGTSTVQHIRVRDTSKAAVAVLCFFSEREGG